VKTSNSFTQSKSYSSSSGRGRWTKEEHNLFLEALKLYGKNWEMIEKFVKTRDASHTRSHAQKFFTKLVKFLAGDEGIEYIPDAEVYLEILQRKILKPRRKRTDHPKVKIFELTKDFSMI
jgi:SHAQKYF class myb-like DNA-binding protein